MSNYSALWRAPGFARVIISQLAARFPFGMMSLALVMHIEQVHDSYAIAGIALGAETIGAAISGPFLSRMMGPYGVRRVLMTATVISSAAMFAIGAGEAPALVMIGLALVVGLSSPPIQAAVRTIYPTLVKKRQLPTVYSLDATAQELIWVVGPILATILAAQISTSFAVIVMAVVHVFGAIWFVSNREVGSLVIPKSKKKLGGVLKNKLVYTNAILGLLLVGSFGGVEVGLVAILDKALAGLVIAFLSLGSIVGGLFLGNRARSRWALTKFLLLLTVGYSLAWFNPQDPLWLCFSFFVAGLGVAPAFGVLGTIIATNLKMSDTAEAYGWVGTGQLVGFSAGAAIAGIAIDTVSPESSLLIAIVFALGCLIVSVMAISVTPALDRNQPETGAIDLLPDKTKD